MTYASENTFEAEATPGVAYTLRRMSFGRRLELTRAIWDLARKLEYKQAGQETHEKLEAAVLSGEIDRVYLQWGLVRVEGLSIDGEPATPESVIERGPEALTSEIAARIKAQCALSAEERKN